MTRVIDLTGKYVVPPFGEGHNHNTDSELAVERYLKAGIFYVSNPNSHPSARSTLHPRFNSPSGVDVQLAGGGLTGTGGHPIFVVQRNIDRKVWTEADGEGAFYHAIDSPGDVDRKWPAILAARPDFIKIYLLYSEEFAQRCNDRAFIGWKGLDPALVPLIVQDELLGMIALDKGAVMPSRTGSSARRSRRSRSGPRRTSAAART